MTNLQIESMDRKYAALLAAIGSGDPESEHGEADDLLLQLLRDLGFVKVIEAFDAVKKWYA